MASIPCRRPARTSPRSTRSRAPTRMRSRCAASSAPSRRRPTAGFAARDRAGRRSRSARAIATVVDKDEHPRADTTLETLGQAADGVPRPDGTVTAGNASGVNDGAAALIVASEAAAKRTASRRWRASSAAPRPASRRASWASARCRRPRKLLRAAGLKLDRDRRDRTQRGLRRAGARRAARSSALPTTRRR